VRVQTGTALIAGVAALALGLTACTSSKSGGGGDTSGTTNKSSASNNGGNNANATAGTKGTGNFANCNTDTNTCNSGTASTTPQFTYTLEKTLFGWDINDGNSSTFELQEVLDGILPGVYTATPDLKPALESEVMDSAVSTVNADDTQTIVYKVKPAAVWNDGSPIGFDDFQYMANVSNPATCPDCAAASTAGYKQISKMVSSDSGKTITVTLSKPFPDWQTMFGTLDEAKLAAQHGDLTTPKGRLAAFNWVNSAPPTFSGGPYLITSYKKDSSVTEVVNPKWYGTAPKIQKLIFQIIQDQTAEVPALQNKEVDAIYPQPNQSIVNAANGLQNAGVQTYLGKGLQWEHIDLNTANPMLKDKVLREAIFDAINRKDLTARTVGIFAPGIQPLNNRMYVPGQAGYQDNVSASGQGNGNVTAAKALLQGAGYTGIGTALKNPAGLAINIGCSFTTGNVLRQQSCTILQNQLKALGIGVTLKPTADLGGTLGKGTFDMIIYAWVGTPYVVAGAQQIWELEGGGDYAKNNDPAAEALINQAAVSPDQASVRKLLNQADVLLTKDAFALPLFQKPTFLAAYNTTVNIRDNATSIGPPYNVAAWGSKS
jgi:peptide/nickel transport system substrate-binding protein